MIIDWFLLWLGGLEAALVLWHTLLFQRGTARNVQEKRLLSMMKRGSLYLAVLFPKARWKPGFGFLLGWWSESMGILPSPRCSLCLCFHLEPGRAAPSASHRSLPRAGLRGGWSAGFSFPFSTQNQQQVVFGSSCPSTGWIP